MTSATSRSVPARIGSDRTGQARNTCAASVGGAAAAPSAGESIERTPDGDDSNANATDFTVTTTPTPKASNG